MYKKIIYIVIIPVLCIAALVILVVFKNKPHNFLTTVDITCIEASGIDFSAEYHKNDNTKSIMLTLDNHNNYEITYGEEYYLEVEKAGKWYEVIDVSGKRTDEKNWNALAYTMKANEQKELVISLDKFKDLEAGNYRFVKYVNMPTRNQTNSACNIIMAYFQVTN